MTVNSLINFGVPGISFPAVNENRDPDETTESALFGVPNGGSAVPMSPPPPAARSRPLQPVMRQKFRVDFSGFGTGVDIAQQVNTVGLPSLTFNVVQNHNDSTYRTGSAHWNPISISFRDTITSTMIESVMAQVAKQEKDRDDSKFDIMVDLVDMVGVIRRYIYRECLITWMGYEKELDYSQPEAITFALQFQPTTVEMIDGADLNKAKATVETPPPPTDPLYEPIRR